MDLQILTHLKQAINFFVFHFLELSVLFLVVSFFVEILNFYLKPQKVQKILSTNKSSYFIAAILGSLTPFCSCSTIPLTIGLLKARASFGAVMTFLFTSPLLNPIIIIVFISAFSLQVTLIYSFIAFFVSIFCGYALQKLGFSKYIKNEIFENEVKKPKFSLQKPQNFTNISFKVKEKTFKDLIKDKNIYKSTWKQFLSFMPFIALGIAIGAFVHGFVPEHFLAKYAGSENPYAVIISAIIGIPLYIRAASMVGIAPALLAKGVSMGSILALCIAGAGASLPEVIMLHKIFKFPIIAFFLVCVFTMAIGCGFLVNLVL